MPFPGTHTHAQTHTHTHTLTHRARARDQPQQTIHNHVRTVPVRMSETGRKLQLYHHGLGDQKPAAFPWPLAPVRRPSILTPRTSTVRASADSEDASPDTASYSNTPANPYHMPFPASVDQMPVPPTGASAPQLPVPPVLQGSASGRHTQLPPLPPPLLPPFQPPPTRPKPPAASMPLQEPSAAAVPLEVVYSNFAMRDLTKAPVVLIFAPRRSGATTVAAGLVADWHAASPLAACFILTDRPLPAEVAEAFPEVCLTAVSGLEATLQALVDQQFVHGRKPGKVALIVDECQLTGKVLKCSRVRFLLERASASGIGVFMTTPNITVVPKDARTFITHVLAAQPVGGDEAKALHRTLFTRFKKAAELHAILDSLEPYQFLVSHVRNMADDEMGLQPTPLQLYRASPESAVRALASFRKRICAVASGAAGPHVQVHPPSPTERGPTSAEPDLVGLPTANSDDEQED